MDSLLVVIFMFLLIFVSVIYFFFTKRSRPHLGERRAPASIMVVVGSGGHTTEILNLVGQLGDHYTPRYYMIANTDIISERKVHFVEEKIKQKGSSEYSIYKIPRSREVLQSWISSVLSTMYASLYCFPLVFTVKPEIILCNGPGTCIPICIAGLLLKWLRLQNTVIVYVESICRVETLSMSAKILYKFADHMLVQWPLLHDKYPKSKYIGRVV